MKWFGLVLCVVPALGCARNPNVGSELPLRRVVVYRNGVGYFERSGQVEGDRVTFAMRQRMVGDFLASLAVIQQGGSSVRSASFPLELDDRQSPAPDEKRRNPQILPPDLPDSPEPGHPPTADDLRDVVLHLDGDEHELAIGYLSETPVWRPSYRVVVSPDGKADLQAWGIVQNLSGEDWNGVSLSLVAGAPLAFQSTLGTPVIPQRPIVTDQGEVMAVVPTGVTSLDQPSEGEAAPGAMADHDAAAPAPEESRVTLQERDEAEDGAAAPGLQRGRAAKRATSAGAPGASTPASLAVAPAPAPPPPTLSAPRKLSDLAAVAVEAGTTRYDIPYPVTVPNDSATMVLLTSRSVPGEAVLLFAPEPGVLDSHSHPFRVARFKNSTPGLLERGPIAVFERASFLGQGMLEPLPPRATATVPFALERSVGVSSERRSDQQGARLYRIEAGQLFIERDAVERTTYRIENGSGRATRLLVKHPRSAGWRLFQPPPGTEDNLGTSSALVPVGLAARGKTELVIDERNARQQAIDWLHPLADEAVKAYLADPRANTALAAELRDVWVVRDGLRKTVDEHTKLTNERDELERLADDTRRSLRAIEKNPQAADLRQKLTKRLADSSARLDTLTKRAIELKLAIDEQQVRLRDAVRDLRFDAPLPPKP